MSTCPYLVKAGIEAMVKAARDRALAGLGDFERWEAAFEAMIQDQITKIDAAMAAAQVGYLEAPPDLIPFYELEQNLADRQRAQRLEEQELQAFTETYQLGPMDQLNMLFNLGGTGAFDFANNIGARPLGLFA